LNFLLTLSLFLLTLSLVINGKERKKEEGSKITKNWTLLQEICKKFGKRRLYEKIKLTTKICIKFGKRETIREVEPPCYLVTCYLVIV